MWGCCCSPPLLRRDFVGGRAQHGGCRGQHDLAALITSARLYKAGLDLSAKALSMADERMGTLIGIQA